VRLLLRGDDPAQDPLRPDVHRVGDEARLRRGLDGPSRLAWVTQQARNLSIDGDDRAPPVRFLIHDRDSKFSGSFDEVFRSEGTEVILSPIRAPNANAFAERWVRTVRAECLDWMLILGRRHLDRVLRTYVAHYNGHRARIGRSDSLRRWMAPRIWCRSALGGPPAEGARRADPRVSRDGGMTNQSFGPYAMPTTPSRPTTGA
jgi:transposase InsO family protein